MPVSNLERVDVTWGELVDWTNGLRAAEGSPKRSSIENAYLTGAKEALEAIQNGSMADFVIGLMDSKAGFSPARILEALRDDLRLAARRFGQERHKVAFAMVERFLDDLYRSPGRSGS